MRVVSPAEIARQVQREGRRYGLRPCMRDGKCYVAQRELMVSTGAVVNVLVEAWEPFRSVDMAHPLSNIWRSRKMRHQHDLAKVMAKARAKSKERDDAALADRVAYRRKELDHVVAQTGMQTFWEAVADVHGKSNPH